MLFKTLLALAFASLTLAQNTCRPTTSTRRNGNRITSYITRCATVTASVQGSQTTITTTSVTTSTTTSTRIISGPASTRTITRPAATSTATVTVTSTPAASAIPNSITVVGFEADNCRNNAVGQDGDRSDLGIVQVSYTAPRAGSNPPNQCVTFSDRYVRSLEFDYNNSALFNNQDCNLVLYRSLNCDINTREAEIDLDPNSRELCRDPFQNTVRSLRIECANI